MFRFKMWRKKKKKPKPEMRFVAYLKDGGVCLAVVDRYGVKHPMVRVDSLQGDIHVLNMNAAQIRHAADTLETSGKHFRVIVHWTENCKQEVVYGYE